MATMDPPPSHIPDAGTQSQQLLLQLLIMCGGNMHPIRVALDLLSGLRHKSSRQSSSCRTTLDIGELKIPVELSSSFILWLSSLILAII